MHFSKYLGTNSVCKNNLLHCQIIHILMKVTSIFYCKITGLNFEFKENPIDEFTTGIILTEVILK